MRTGQVKQKVYKGWQENLQSSPELKRNQSNTSSLLTERKKLKCSLDQLLIHFGEDCR